MRHDCNDCIRLGKLKTGVKIFRLSSTPAVAACTIYKRRRHVFCWKVLYTYKECMEVAKDLILLAKRVVLHQILDIVSSEEIPLLKKLRLVMLKYWIPKVEWKSNESVVSGATLRILPVCVFSVRKIPELPFLVSFMHHMLQCVIKGEMTDGKTLSHSAVLVPFGGGTQDCGLDPCGFPTLLYASHFQLQGWKRCRMEDREANQGKPWSVWDSIASAVIVLC